MGFSDCGQSLDEKHGILDGKDGDPKTRIQDGLDGFAGWLAPPPAVAETLHRVGGGEGGCAADDAKCWRVAKRTVRVDGG